MIRLEKNAEVYSAQDEKIGLIDRVVLNPETMKISHIVVKEGFLFKTSKVIPIWALDFAGEKIQLKEDGLDPDDLPEFDEKTFVLANETFSPNREVDAFFWAPPMNFAWWSAYGNIWYPMPKFVRKTQAILPEGAIPLEEGAKVICMDREEVGTVERVIVDPTEKVATHIVVGQGLLSKEYKLVPTFWIADVKEDEVSLLVSLKTLMSLPEHELIG